LLKEQRGLKDFDNTNYYANPLVLENADLMKFFSMSIRKKIQDIYSNINKSLTNQYKSIAVDECKLTSCKILTTKVTKPAKAVAKLSEAEHALFNSSRVEVSLSLMKATSARVRGKPAERQCIYRRRTEIHSSHSP
jgi:hypothetical protein